jgi:hypothetical protein
MNQVIVASVMPNDRPNTMGLRHETGPSQEPPSTANTTACTPPLATRRVAQP